MRLTKIGLQLVTTSRAKSGTDFEHASRAVRCGVAEAMLWLLVVALALLSLLGLGIGLWLSS